MLRDRRMAGVLLAASCALTAHGADRGAAKPPSKTTPDLEFLEYLGTLESDEDNWKDVLNVELPAAARTKPKGDAQKGKAKAESAAKGAGGEK
jgi:hypothetical protein